MERDGIAKAFGGYTVVVERTGETSFTVILLEKGTYKDVYYDRHANLDRIPAAYFRAYATRHEIMGGYIGGVNYTAADHAHKRQPDPTKFEVDFLGGMRYVAYYSTAYREVLRTESTGTKEFVDKVMSDPDFAKRQVDAFIKRMEIESAGRVNNLLIDIGINIVPGLNTADKILKGDGVDITVAILEDGSTLLGVGLVTKTVKATARAKIVASAMMAGATGVSYGRAGYEFRYGDPDKAMVYLSEANLRLLGFTAFEILQVRKAGEVLRKLEAAKRRVPHIDLTGSQYASPSPGAVRPDRHCVVPEQPLSSPKPTGELHGPPAPTAGTMPVAPTSATSPPRFVTGVTVTDIKTGKILTGTVDLKPTLDRISSGVKLPHRNDGSIFQNRPNVGKTIPELPVKPAGYYKEYVHPTPGVTGPGPQRIVTGQGGEIYYTPDHYLTFIKVK